MRAHARRHPHHDARVALPAAHVRARARPLASVETVIVDEIHALVPSKRGAHLFLSLERLEALRPAGRRRSSASASAPTQRPLDEVARLLGGFDARRPAARRRSSTPAARKQPRARGREPSRRSPTHGGEPASRSTQDRAVRARGASGRGIHARVVELVRAHRSTIIFVNSRRLAERLATALNDDVAGRGDRARAPRLGRAREADRHRRAPQARRPPGDRRDLVARARASTWARSISSSRSRRRRASRRACSASAARATASAASRAACSCRSTGRTSCRVRGGHREHARAARSRRRSTRATRSTSSRSRSSPPSSMDDTGVERELFDLRAPRRALRRPAARRRSTACSTCSAGRYPSDEFAELRPRVTWDRARGTRRGPRGRAAPRHHQRRHHPRPRASTASSPPAPASDRRDRRPPRRRARRGDGLRAPRRARCSSSARRRGAPRRSRTTASS